MSESKHKLVYVLPEYRPDTDTHYAYLYSFIELIAQKLNMLLIVEKAPEKPMLKGVTDTFIKTASGALGRLFQGIVFSLQARMRGCRDFYVHYSFIGAFAAIVVTKLFGGRVFYWNCGMPWLYTRPAFEEWVFRYILRYSILVTGAESLRDSYVKEYQLDAVKTRILPNWIDTKNTPTLTKEEARSVLGIDRAKPVALFVHHLSKRKGSDMIVPTAELLPDVTFLVVGDGPEKANLENGVPNNVRIIGTVPHTKIGVYFAASDVFFMPSEEEGFPHVLLEAMLYGVPYVASDVGAVRDMSPDVEQPFIVSEQNPQNFARVLNLLLENPIGKNVLQEHVQQFDTWDAVENFLKVFE